MAVNIKNEPAEAITTTQEDDEIVTPEEMLTSSSGASGVCSPEGITHLGEKIGKNKEGFKAAKQRSKVPTIPPLVEEEIDETSCKKCCASGHPCNGKKDPDCPPCDIKFQLLYENCKHKLIMPCYLGRQEKYKNKCHKMFASPWTCACGEKVYLPCYLGGKRLTWTEAMKWCPKCGDDKDLPTVFTYSTKYGK